MAFSSAAMGQSWSPGPCEHWAGAGARPQKGPLFPASGIGPRALSWRILPQSCAPVQKGPYSSQASTLGCTESNSGYSRLNCLLYFLLTFILDQTLPPPPPLPLFFFSVCLRLTLIQFRHHPYFSVCMWGV